MKWELRSVARVNAIKLANNAIRNIIWDESWSADDHIARYKIWIKAWDKGWNEVYNDNK